MDASKLAILDEQEAGRKTQKPPQLNQDQVCSLLAEMFDLELNLNSNQLCIDIVTELDSYDDRNYYFKLSNSEEFILKIHNGLDSRHENGNFIQCQVKCLQHLNTSNNDGVNINCPVDICESKLLKIVPPLVAALDETERQNHYCVRILKYIPGLLLYDRMKVALNDEIDRLQVLHNLGIFLAEVDQKLLSFNHSASKRVHVWDLKHFLQVKPFAEKGVKDGEQLELLFDIFDEYAQEMTSIVSSKLRETVIQSDPNDRNLVVLEDDTFAILDFGDMVYTWLICEISIALAYCIVGYFTDVVNDEDFDDEIWLKRCQSMVKGYCSKLELNSTETNCIYILAKARLCTSASIGAYSASKAPENEYLLIHSQPAWRSIRAMKRVGKTRFLQVVCSDIVPLSQQQPGPKKLRT